MRNIWLVGILVLPCPRASAMDLRTFNGRCTEGAVKQAPPAVDMRNIRGSPVPCGAASIAEFDNGRKLVQFVQKHGKLNPQIDGIESLPQPHRRSRLSCIRGALVKKTGRGDIARREQPIATRQKP